MYQYCVVVADGSRARFFTLKDADIPEIQSGPNLVEMMDLSNPEHSMQGQEMWSDKKSGRNRSSASGQSHGYDDHRQQHEEEIEKRFASSIANECARLSKESGANLILVSPKRMLGHLRSAMETKMSGVSAQELAKDLSKLNTLQLHEHLAKERLIPERKGPGA